MFYLVRFTYRHGISYRTSRLGRTGVEGPHAMRCIVPAATALRQPGSAFGCTFWTVSLALPPHPAQTGEDSTLYVQKDLRNE